jgi:hypothetical protein
MIVRRREWIVVRTARGILRAFIVRVARAGARVVITEVAEPPANRVVVDIFSGGTCVPAVAVHNHSSPQPDSPIQDKLLGRAAARFDWEPVAVAG